MNLATLHSFAQGIAGVRVIALVARSKRWDQRAHGTFPFTFGAQVTLAADARIILQYWAMQQRDRR